MAKSDDIFEEPISEDELLTPAEIAKIKLEAKQEILKAKRADLRKKLLADETQRLRTEEGLTTGNAHSDEIVNITIDLPLFTPNIIINMKAYWHGSTYPVPRHVADTLRAQMFDSWKHQSQIDGKSAQQFYSEKHVAELYQPGNKGKTISARSA